ncbi:UNVERIFIED_CONTAM: Myosin 10A, isoform D [Siphonaria sp. JEL0065]|nr:Myosin 10A, isoform D [Siphonaria sp. JEL0065]
MSNIQPTEQPTFQTATPPQKPPASLKAFAHNHTFAVASISSTESDQTSTLTFATATPQVHQPSIIYAQALYDFVSHEPDELPFEEQDLIIIPPLDSSHVVGAAAGWLYGENNGIWGWFPESFVRILSPQEAVEVASADLASAGRFKAVQGSVKPYLIDSIDSLATNYSTRRDSIASMESLMEEEEIGDDDDTPLGDSDAAMRSKYADLVAKATTEQHLQQQQPQQPQQQQQQQQLQQQTTSATPPAPKKTWLSNINNRKSMSSPAAPKTPSSTPVVTSCIPNQSAHDISTLISLPSKVSTLQHQIHQPQIHNSHRRISIDPISASTAPIPSTPLIERVKNSTLPQSSSPASSSTSLSKTIAILGSPAITKKLWIDTLPGGSESLDKLGISPAERKRQEVIYEIISTEKDYVADLQVILGVYMHKLKTGKVLRGKDISVIFSNLEVILPVNMELLKRLEERQALHINGVVEQIGDIFIKVTDYLKMYTMYCSNHPFALMKLQTVRQTRSVAKFLDAIAHSSECRNLDLSNFLLKPIQRICKYPLLIREAIRHTSTYHPDYAQLTTALSKIETVVTIVNEGARQAENVQRMLELQTRLTIRTSIVIPSRVLKKYGVCEYLGKSSGASGRGGKDSAIMGGKRKRCEVYLFNDVLILAKPIGGGSGVNGGSNDNGSGAMEKLKLMAMVPFDMILINCPATPVPASVSTNARKDGSLSKDLHLIEVVHVNTAKFTLALESVTTKAAWVKALQEATQEWLASKTRLPPSPSKLGVPPILARNSQSNTASPVTNSTSSHDKAAVPIQFQLDGVPVGSLSQLVEEPFVNQRPPLKPTLNEPVYIRRKVNVPTPIGTLGSANEVINKLASLKKREVSGSPTPKSNLSDSNDDLSLSEIVNVRTKLSKVGESAPKSVQSDINGPKNSNETDSEDEACLTKIIKKLPLTEGTTILKSSRDFGSKGSLTRRQVLGSTETLSSTSSILKDSIQEVNDVYKDCLGDKTENRIVSSSRLALNNFIVQDQSKPHQSSQHYMSQQPTIRKPNGIPHSASMADTSSAGNDSNLQSVVVTSSLPTFRANSKESIHSQPVSSIENIDTTASATSTSSLPTAFQASSKEPLMNLSQQSGSGSSTDNLQTSLHSLQNAKMSHASNDSLSIGTRSTQSQPSLVVNLAAPPPIPPSSRKPSTSGGSKDVLGSTESLEKVSLSAVTVEELEVDTPEMVTKVEAPSTVKYSSEVVVPPSVPSSLSSETAQESTSLGISPSLPPSIHHSLKFTRSHTDQPSTSPKKSAGVTTASAGLQQNKNPLIQVSTRVPSVPQATHTRAFSAVDRSRAFQLEHEEEEEEEPHRHLSVRERQAILLNRSKGVQHGTSGGAARAKVFRAEATGEAADGKNDESWRRSVGVESGAEKRRNVDSGVYSSTATVTVNEEVGEEDRDGNEIEQLSMNKPVKKVVVSNVVQQTGKFNKDFTFEDFFDFHMSLVAQFPEDAGVQSPNGSVPARIIPEFPPQMMFVSEAVAKLRMSQLQSYAMVS